jgi:hypothetical protein
MKTICRQEVLEMEVMIFNMGISLCVLMRVIYRYRPLCRG